MNPFRVVCCAGLLSVLCAVPAVAAHPGCANPEQVGAAQLRQLHYELQVSALNCRNTLPEMPAKWQHYLERHGAALANNAQVLRGYFKSVSAFDRHNTIVTNRLSVLVHETPDYCGIHASLFDKVASLPPPQLISFAAETEGDPMEIRPCPQHKTPPHKAPHHTTTHHKAK